MFALGIRYLTGYAVATDISSRERAEWPPHPARVFMALSAAYFETEGDVQERAALTWLEQQGPPEMRFSDADHRDIVRHFVPVNDRSGPARMMLQSAPNLPRDRKERFFPRVRPIEDTVYMCWSQSKPDHECVAAMDRLCGKVVRVGHSASLVQMWVEHAPPESNWMPRASRRAFSGLNSRRNSPMGSQRRAVPQSAYGRHIGKWTPPKIPSRLLRASSTETLWSWRSTRVPSLAWKLHGDS